MKDAVLIEIDGLAIGRWRQRALTAEALVAFWRAEIQGRAAEIERLELDLRAAQDEVSASREWLRTAGRDGWAHLQAVDEISRLRDEVAYWRAKAECR